MTAVTTATEGARLLTGIEAGEVVDGLDRLRSSHLVSMQLGPTRFAQNS
jgi:hypothetical protein